MSEVVTFLGDLGARLLVAGLLAWWLLETWVIRRLAARITRGERNARRRVLAIAQYTRSMVVARSDDPYFCGIAWLEPLGASPLAVLRDGACCSGRSRLCTVLLRAAGVNAHQITLYHRSGAAQHALVEARIDGAAILLDPSYGLYYVDSSGAPLGSDRLRAGMRPRFRCLSDDGIAAYPENAYYDFDYRATRTANWTRSAPRRLTYRLLHVLTRGGIDRLPQPVLLEWPQLVLAAAVLLATFTVNVIAG